MTSPIRTAAERAATALEPAVWELVRDLHMMAEDNRKIDWLREEQICLQSADRLASLAAERDTLERSSLESSMLAHGWMVAHNKLLGWVQKHQDVLNRLIDERPDIPLPSPVDLPNALRDRDALAARVSELEGDGWQDIATCPRNGLPFLAGWFADGGYWWTIRAHWANGVIDGGWNGALEGDDHFAAPATHWRPLPTPPGDHLPAERRLAEPDTDGDGK